MSDSHGLKRKHVEDPDYAFVSENKRTAEEQMKLQKEIREARSKTAVKAYNIINKNFTEELRSKETEIEAIEAMLLQVQKALHLVRFAAVTNMYSTPAVIGTNRQDPCIHPATRQLLQGKRPVSSTIASTSTNMAIKDSQDTVMDSIANMDDSMVPSYVSPKKTVVEIEPRGVQHKYKRRIIVGNVSRWIECDQREDLSTHKWMIYVRGSKEEPDISDVVSKVKFLIHQSYHPNNLIEVHRPPYHLTRRGWGEFPARIQIHFKNPVDKPIDIVHLLRLDKTYTGLQTLGSETIVDVWLHRLNNNSSNVATNKSSSTNRVDLGPVNSVKRESVNSSENSSNKIEYKKLLVPEIKCIAKEKENESSLFKENQQSRHGFDPSGDVQTTFIRCKDKGGGSFILPVTVLPKNCQKRVDWNPLKSHQVASIEVVGEDVTRKFSVKNGTTGNGSHSIGDSGPLTSPSKSFSPVKAASLPAGTSLLRSSKFLPTPPTSRPSTPSTSPTRQNVLTWRHVLSGKKSSMTLEEFEKKISQIDIFFLHKNLKDIFTLRQKLMQLRATSFSDDESSFFLQLFRWFPLVSDLAKEGSPYRILLPFTAQTVAQFQSWPLTRQRAVEWIRAKTVQKILTILRGPKKTTKELVMLSRRYGFVVQPKGQRENTSFGSSIDVTRLSTYTAMSTSCLSTAMTGNEGPGDGADGDDDDDVVIVDVVSDDAKPSKIHTVIKVEPVDEESHVEEKCSRLVMSDDNLEAQSFIESTIGQLGLRTEIEEVQPGIFYPFAQKLLLSACRNFCEELIRRSHGSAFDNKSSTIELPHVVKAIVESKRMSFLTNADLGEPSRKSD